MNLDAAGGFFSYIPTDWIVIAAFAALITFDALRAGAGRACALALSLPATLLIIAELPHARILSGAAEQFSSPLSKSVLFGIVFPVIYILVRRMGIHYTTSNGKVMQAIMAGVAATAVLVVVWLQVPELQSIWNFGPQVQSIFGEQHRFWWFLGSYAALAYVRG